MGGGRVSAGFWAYSGVFVHIRAFLRGGIPGVESSSEAPDVSREEASSASESLLPPGGSGFGMYGLGG